MYGIQATVSRRDGQWEGTRQVPTFYLDERVQGIVSEDHAAEIARDIINPYRESALSVHVIAVKIDPTNYGTGHHAKHD